MVSLDNYFTGSEKNHVNNVVYLKGKAADIDNLIDFSPDYIYHLGEYSRVEQSFDDIDKVWEFNTQGTFSVLQFCKKTGAKLIYAGSSTKFGDGGAGRSQSPYAWTKASNTDLIVNYSNWFAIPYAIVYFYNVYGDREISTGKYATLIALFTEKMKQGKSLTVVSPGAQERNFTHVEDIVNGLILVGEKGSGDEYGIGSSESFTILEVAKLFGGVIEMLPARKGNRMVAEVITDKTKDLGWMPKHNLASYIENLKIRGWCKSSITPP